MKVALVHLCSFGDCLYATLIARQIRKDFPGCHLTWIVGDRYASICRNNPDIDEVWPIVISSVSDAMSDGWERALLRVAEQENAGRFDLVFRTQIQPENILLYDGLIRSTIYRAYPRPVDGPHHPVLVVDDEERGRVAEFARRVDLSSFRHVILFECGPRSGQSSMTPERAEKIAAQLVNKIPDLLLILSSDRPPESPSRNIVDGSELSFRENAILATYCTGLIGCSSGITWVTTSTAGRVLPMLQVLTASTQPFRFASVAADFERFGLESSQVIELIDPDDQMIVDCVVCWLFESHEAARLRYHAPPRLTQAHLQNAFRLWRQIDTSAAWCSLWHFVRMNRLGFPWWLPLREGKVIVTDGVNAIRSLLRRILASFGLLSPIRRSLGRDPQTGAAAADTTRDAEDDHS